MRIAEAGGVTIERLMTPDDVASWRPDFIGAYQTVFGDEPFFERWWPAEAEGLYRKLTRSTEHISLLALDDERLVGFGIAIPLQLRPDVARELTGLLNIERTMYFAELGVLPQFRGKGIGGALINERLRLMDRDRYTDVVVRVSASRNVSYRQYLRRGFENVGVPMEVTALRMDGRVTTDRRLILHGRLDHLRGDA